MWTEFEWENRVNVTTNMSYVGFLPSFICNSIFYVSDPREYLKHVMKATNMSCLTPEGAISGECDFLSANMYARSLFGELDWLFLAIAQPINQVLFRRGCIGKLERGEDGYWHDHGSCPYS